MTACRLALLALVASPFALFGAGPPCVPLHQRIDELIAAKSADFAKFDAGPASDMELFRRLHLDLVGRIPTSAEARAFLADRGPNKRTALIDKLLASPEHSRHMAVVFDVMLMERQPSALVPQVEWHEFLRRSFLANTPYDVMAREILSGDDADPTKRYRAKFILDRAAEPHRVTRDLSRLFLGMNLQCAQCHDHPLNEDWKQDHYYGLFAFVSRTSIVVDRAAKASRLAEKADGEVSFQSVFDPRKETKTTLPRVPGGLPLSDVVVDKAKPYILVPAAGVASRPRYSRRARLAEAITRPNYVPFRRNIANRLWALMIGRGLVEPFDRDSLVNPPSHPELLELLADDIAARKFDMRSFLRELALSRTYQRSSERPAGDQDGPLYSTAILKPLTPEQLGWSLIQATGLMETHRLSLGAKATEEAMHARLGGLIPTFVRAFGGNPGEAQTFDARMDQALFLANGPTVRSWLVSREGSLVARLEKLSGAALADELYLSVFTRLPDDEERKEVADFLARRPKALADLAWGLMASTEFRFNH
jgi:Protein of unknown function (DUF1549)/Protein of unknown function (DUF1553)